MGGSSTGWNRRWAGGWCGREQYGVEWEGMVGSSVWWRAPAAVTASALPACGLRPGTSESRPGRSTRLVGGGEEWRRAVRGHGTRGGGVSGRGGQAVGGGSGGEGGEE